MKRIFSLILAALLLTGCSSTYQPKETLPAHTASAETEKKPNPDETKAPDTPQDLDITKLAAKSANFGITPGMMSYFFHLTYEQYSSMAIYYGLDTKTSAKEQSCLLSEGGTWFHFFLEETVFYVSELLSLCESAKEQNLTLDENDTQTLDEQVSLLKSQASASGINLSQLLYVLFGCDMTEAEYRRCLELTLLADKATANFTDNFVSLTPEDYEAYYAEHTTEFISVDILSFSVAAKDFADLDETAAAEAVALWRDRLMNAADGDTYKAIAKEYMETVLALDEEETELRLADILVPGVRLHNISDPSLAEWMFRAAKGDSKAYSFDSNSYDVLYVADVPYRNEAATRNLRHLSFTTDSYNTDEEAKAAAQTAYAEWEAAGFDSETFVKLYEKYGSSESAANAEGLYENVAPNIWVEEIDEWLFAEERTAGDHALIETVYGWHIVDFVGISPLTAWQADVRSAIISASYDDMLTRLGEQIEFNDTVLNEIDA